MADGPSGGRCAAARGGVGGDGAGQVGGGHWDWVGWLSMFWLGLPNPFICTCTYIPAFMHTQAGVAIPLARGDVGGRGRRMAVRSAPKTS